MPKTKHITNSREKKIHLSGVRIKSNFLSPVKKAKLFKTSTQAIFHKCH